MQDYNFFILEKQDILSTIEREWKSTSKRLLVWDILRSARGSVILVNNIPPEIAEEIKLELRFYRSFNVHNLKDRGQLQLVKL